jgi:hypothetical protein
MVLVARSSMSRGACPEDIAGDFFLAGQRRFSPSFEDVPSLADS